MKKLVSFIFAGCLMSALVLNASMARAEKTSEMSGADQDHADMKGDHKGMDHMGGMKEKLGLTDDQVAKMKETWKSQQESVKPLRDQERVDMALLKQKVDSKASDSDIKVALEKLKADHKALQDAQESMTKKMSTILTPTQQAKMLLGMARRMGASKAGMMKSGMKDKMKEKKGRPKKHKKVTADDKAPAPEKDDKK